MPGESLPPTKLDDTRAALHAAAARVWTALGWPADRAFAYPPQQVITPSAWVDVPTLHQAPTERARAMAATFPVVFLTDGGSEQQVKLQDRLLAHAWDQLDNLQLSGGHRTTVQSAGPEDLEVLPGVFVRGLAIRVQVPLMVQTLCPQKLARDNDEGTG
jgi:hypothetical protein